MGRFHVVLGIIFVPCCFFVLLTDTSMEVAHGKPIKAEKLYDKRSYWDADKVVDGNINTNVYCNSCLHTKPNGAAKAWWRVDLEEQHAIDRVEIYNAEPHEPKQCDNGIKQNVSSTVARQENDRLKGYSIYVSTKKKVPSGEPCYKDPSGSGQYPDLYQDNSCEGVGRYVSIYNDHKATVGPLNGAALVLCEVKVYGCPIGHFGENCSRSCSSCKGTDCNPTTGVCKNGCVDGRRGLKCDEDCPEGYYGAECKFKCGGCKNISDCDARNGECTSGCSPGYNGSYCEECPNGTFGENCIYKCGKCREAAVCRKEDGVCPNGCQDGYQIPKCQKECDDGKYGTNCSLDCGKCKDGKTCDKANGHCQDGCQRGYMFEPPTCDVECPDGKYGNNCRNDCGKCANDAVCIKRNGNCPSGCKDGYRNERCKKECPAGKYGKDCALDCGKCSNTKKCNNVDGTCPNRTCQDGYKPPTCHEECDDGQYGTNCSMDCGNCRNNDTCNKISGHCPNSCQDGYKPPICIEECADGQYGTNCSMDCGKCRNNDTCHKDNGHCPSSCQDGYQPPTCSEECADGQYGTNCSMDCGNCRNNDTCNKVNGYCPNSCQDGYKPPTCSEGCDDGQYGTNCSMDCGECRNNDTCNKGNGYCPNSCQDGYKPPLCIEECDDGQYGTNCSMDCGHCRDYDACNNVNGHCPNSCQDGYMPPLCIEDCDDGHYGTNCSLDCGKCRNADTCYKGNGHCPNSCQDGYKPPTCSEECDDGQYGTNCSMDCGNCRNNDTCNKVSGHCPNSCHDGYKLPTCSEECDDGQYGTNCSMDCGECRNNDACNNVNGHCPNSCQDGYIPPLCIEECDDGQYGTNCSMDCGKCRNNDTCNKDNGHCPNSCQDGYKLPTCSEDCEDGQYGKDCSMDCGKCRNTEACNKVSGYCPNSCEDGFKQPTCHEDCDYGQYGTNCSLDCGKCRNADTCYKDNGHCPNNCQDGYKPPTCSEVCDPFWYGEDCTKACGKCRNGEACDSVTGTCATGCTDGWMGGFCNQERLQENDESNFSSVSVVGIVIGLVALMIAVVLVLLFVRRRNQQQAGPPNDAGIKINVEDTSNFGGAKPKNRRDGAMRNDNKRDGTSDEAQPMMELTNGDAHTSNGISDQHNETFRVDSMYINTVPSRTAVGITEIRDMIKTKINEDIFDKEYKRLPKGLFYSAEISKYPANTTKNRYITTLPYDSSIVPLSPLPGKQNTDYINANYVDGVTIPKAYIATQGPLPHTVGDFWRMVWETQSERIVMLTKLKEGEKKKCHQYWPSAPGESISAAYLNVQSKHEKMYSAFTIRDFTITNTKTHSAREITQFHFTAWPDHSTPDVLDLVLFQHQVSMKVKSLRGPDVVHCSAGIGRTGTYIGLDALLQYGCTNKTVDIYSYVEAMRKNRLNMVQTKDQYICLHNALAEGFVLNRAFLSSQKFDKILRELEQETTPNNKMHTCTEFRTLHSVRPIVDDKSKMEANKGENRNKNRDKNIIPVSKYKPYLMTQGCYINAVLLPSLTVSPGFIATQYPLPNTLNDFWSLVYDQESSVIVLLEPDIESVMADLSANQESVYGKLSVHFKNSQTTFNGIQQINVSLFREGDTESSHVVILTPSHWPWKEIIPQSPDVLVSLIQMTKRQRKTSEDGPVIVMCCNGSTKCGLFCALCNIAEILHETCEVTVQYVARQLQIRRPEFILDMEQYNYIYTVIGKLIEEESIYVNS